MYLIYCLTHNITQKCYVGYTKNLKKRGREHRSALKRGTHHSPKLQEDYGKYGKDISFSVLEADLSADLVLLAEEKWIGQLDTYNTGYNMLKSGHVVLDRPNQFTQGPKAVTSVDIKTGVVTHYESIAQAAKDVNPKSYNNIASSITGTGAQSSCGKIWFETKDYTLEKAQLKIKGLLESQEKRNSRRKGGRKRWDEPRRTSPQPIIRNDGKIYCSVKSAAEDLGLKPVNISRNLRKDLDHVRGYSFDYYFGDDVPSKPSKVKENPSPFSQVEYPDDPYWLVWRDL